MDFDLNDIDKKDILMMLYFDHNKVGQMYSKTNIPKEFYIGLIGDIVQFLNTLITKETSSDEDLKKLREELLVKCHMSVDTGMSYGISEDLKIVKTKL